MYWTDAHQVRRPDALEFRGGRIRRSNPNGTDAETILYVGSCPCDIVIHGGKIYWSEWHTHSVRRADLDGANTESVLSRGEYIYAITIHGDRIYWAESYWTESSRSTTIQRAHLDGTNVETLVVYGSTRTNIRDIAVHDGKLYWAYMHRIYRSNLDGSASGTFIHDSSVHAIAFHDDKIYWADSSTYSGGGHTEVKRAELANPSGVETLIRTRNYYANGVAIYP